MSDGAITVTHLDERERFRAEILDEDGVPTEVGYLDYTRDSGHSDGDHLALTHTVVFAQYGGRGYAGQLVQQVFDQIRADGNKVIPVCSYVIKYLGQHPEYDDLVVSSSS
ncbi:GNAT family N-acetyltransferase [Gordonia sp. PP30]|uniref:GNAT family N-acetyltransferase n=1 Tax=unclassified Gordonia (in: high G+C Gram-positive bacteria) TaxID=2657482 RepID=UPI001FFFB78B|nr:GNAT family N-acetyltransferase [Gordonia sp. PP30]UQE74623.1 N-acetyltransferase [Gordonia sp. PP30]